MEIKELIQQYDIKKYNVSNHYPITRTGHFHKFEVELLVVSSDPNDGEVHYLTRKQDPDTKKWINQYMLSARTLMTMLSLAGILIDPKLSGTYEGKKKRIVVAKAIGIIRRETGFQMLPTEEYTLDLDAVEADIHAQWTKKGQEYEKKPDYKGNFGEDWVEKKVAQEMLAKTKYRRQLAWTGVRCRLVKNALGLKNTYTAEELKKPFVIPRLILDETIPIIKQYSQNKAMKSEFSLFHNSSEPPEQLPVLENETVLVPVSSLPGKSSTKEKESVPDKGSEIEKVIMSEQKDLIELLMEQVELTSEQTTKVSTITTYNKAVEIIKWLKDATKKSKPIELESQPKPESQPEIESESEPEPELKSKPRSNLKPKSESKLKSAVVKENFKETMGKEFNLD